jgi:hypothetical protein
MAGHYQAHQGVVRYHDHVLAADASSFRLLNEAYAKDRHRVFFEGITIDGADAGSFEVLGQRHARDDKRAYWCSRAIDGANCATMQVLGGDLCRDAQAVYDCSRRLAGADPESFEVLNEEYARDCRHVYRNGSPVQGVNPRDFAAWGGYVRTGDQVTFGGQPVPGSDPATFRGVAGDYARDRAHAYFRGAIIEGADVETLTVLGTAFARDAQHTFLGCEPFTDEPDPAWLGLSRDECVLRVRARAGHAPSMTLLAREKLELGDATAAWVWAKLALAFGDKRASAAVRAAMAQLDPRNELAEELRPVIAEAHLTVAHRLWEGRDVPERRGLAVSPLAAAIASGLTERAARTALVARFGEALVAEAEAVAREPAARPRRVPRRPKPSR